MRRTGKMMFVLALFAGIALAGIGCQQPQTMDDLKVPEGFDFSTTQDVTVKVAVADTVGKAAQGTEVIVAATQDDFDAHNYITRGVTDARGEFERLVRVPARLDALRVQVSPSGVAGGTDVSIVNSELSVSFGPSS